MEKTRISLQIPSEIFHDILVWLPPKSLFRFMLVCKHWKSLIRCPKFVKDHLNANQHGNPNLWRFARLAAPAPALSFSIESIDCDASIVSIDCDASDDRVDVLDEYFDFDQILGSCNGLLLVEAGIFVARKSLLFIWNPSIRKYRQIFGCPLPLPYRFLMAGIGYDCNSEDYKVVITSYSDYYLYSWKEDAWRRMYHNNFSYSLQDGISSCVEVNGFPHWIPYKFERNDILPSVVIVYFDMIEEKWKELSLPDRLSDWSNILQWGSIELGVLKGWLCASLNRKRDCLEVWAMKEYGVAESWTTLFTIPSSKLPYREFPSSKLPYRELRPMTYTRKGEVLIDAGGEKLVIFDLKKRSIKKIIKFKHNFQIGTFVGTFVESLVLQ